MLTVLDVLLALPFDLGGNVVGICSPVGASICRSDHLYRSLLTLGPGSHFRYVSQTARCRFCERKRAKQVEAFGHVI
jgi:hypothetical protein